MKDDKIIDRLKNFNSKKPVDSVVADLVSEMLLAAKEVHIAHLNVSGDGSYAAHKALQELYEALPDLADTLAEGYQGANGKLLTFTEVSVPQIRNVKGAVNYIEVLYEKITTAQKVIPYSEIVNDLDAAKSTLNSVKYKLLFLA